MAALTEEQTMIKDQAKAWVTDQSPVQAFRKLRDSGEPLAYAADTWSAMVEMGWTGILVPEEFGGSNLGYLTFGVVLEELGRQLVASPLLSSALVGTSAVLAGGSDAQRQALLPNLVAGSEVLTLAVDEKPRHAPADIALQAIPSANGYTLTGQKTFVAEGLAATTLIVAARTSGEPGAEAGITLFLVPADAAGLQRSAMQVVDSRGYARMEFAGVEVAADAVLGEVDNGFALLDATLDKARAGVAAEMLGTGAQAFDMTLDYLKTREQFGRVIGSFQALGHRAADLFSAMELARSCGEAALQGLDAQSSAAEQAELASLAKCRVGDFLHLMSNQLIQIHGGIGMTDEFDAGFYLKRARPLAALYGNQAFHRDRYARLLGF